MKLSEQLKIIDSFHDGIIKGINRKKDDILLTIMIEYLAKLIDSQNRGFKVILKNCTKFDFEDWDNKGVLIEDIKEIEKLEPEILSGEIINSDYIKVNCLISSGVGGILRIKYETIKIFDENGTVVSKEQFFDICKNYWNSFKKKK